MAPAPDQFSAPGAVTYDSNTMVVGDGTWEFTKNTFLLPNLQGTNFDTMRYNGMGNRFSTVHQYHTLITAHGVLMTMVFLFFLPASVMLARFYSREPGYAVRYHAQINIFACLLAIAAFVLPFFAVGQARSLTNPHHGIGVAIFVMFLVQIFSGSFFRYITKIRSLRIMLHQWLGRATALLGIVQIPLGLALYGSPKVLFILYAVWMGILLVVYFVLSYQSEGRREFYMSGPRSDIRSEVRSEMRSNVHSELRSEGGRTRMTESEYFSEHNEDHGSRFKWLGPLAAGVGLFALMRNRKKDRDDASRARSRSPSMMSRSRGPTVLSSRPASASYFDEKYSDLPHQKGSGGGFMKILGALGLAKLFSKRQDRDDVYSAVSTETPYRQRSARATTISEFNSEYTDDASTIPPSQNQTNMTASAMESRNPRQPMRSVGNAPRRGFIDESEYSSYVSPSRRPPPPEATGGGGFAQGLLSGLGLGWFSKKMADRRAKKNDDRMEDDDYRSRTEYSNYTGDGDYSPPRRNSRRAPGKRYAPVGTETGLSEITESSYDTRGIDNSGPPPRPRTPTGAPSGLVSGDAPSSKHEIDHPHGVVRSEISDATTQPTRHESSRRRREGERAAAAAAARASNLAAEERDQFGSPKSVSVKLRIHDDKDRNVTLRKLTEQEIAEARDRGDTDISSTIESPNGRYRRESIQRDAEEEAEQRTEVGGMTPLSPPNPAFAKGAKRGQGGPSNLMPPPAVSMVSSIGSHGTWSGMSMSPSQPIRAAADDNRRRRRQERRRESSSRPSAADMFD